MKRVVFLAALLLLPGIVVDSNSAPGESLATQRDALLAGLKTTHNLTDAEVNDMRAIFSASAYLGQGNPEVTEHPATPEQCREKLAQRQVSYENPEYEAICGDKFMAPLFDPATQKPTEATSCIDRFEFPNIPCAYPVVWARAKEAAQLCRAEGKRLCDAHEWEGGCQGSMQSPDYRFDLVPTGSSEAGIRAMRRAHNAKHAADKRWSYGPQYQRGVCGASSQKSPQCSGGSWTKCGSNTYPAGYFPECGSPLGVVDINGNAAEHMNLPTRESEMASTGSRTLGHTEMKGSWFIFDRYRAHEDWCRWRAPYWHGSRVMAENSHRNYHLGFRCCKSLETTASP
ncbi:MAG: hypothetical protein P9L99_10595 [Candidatus Lernaella stagnicola]|nr:hypothetical protein [Candidatus Lernaella stagnicola]